MVASQADAGRDLLSPAEAEAAAWTIAPDVKVGGARAIGLSLAVAWQSKLPVLPWKVPGAPWLLDRTYELIARNRHRLPGVEPWCSAHPGECADRAA